MRDSDIHKKENVRRITVSLPVVVCDELNSIVESGSATNRSQAVTDILVQEIISRRGEESNRVMAGTITIVYDEGRDKARRFIADIQRKYIDEVISSLHVLLEKNYVMEVLVVQGPSFTLKEIADELGAIKGVTRGKLVLTDILLPPLHQ